MNVLILCGGRRSRLRRTSDLQGSGFAAMGAARTLAANGATPTRDPNVFDRRAAGDPAISHAWDGADAR
jgi:hypothetical protein